MQERFPKEKLEKREYSREVLEARNFFIEQLAPLANKEVLEKHNPKELFDAYTDFINTPASREHFFGLVKKYGEGEKSDDYKAYLLKKLPKLLRERNTKTEVEELEEIHKLRNESGSQMILGYHISSENIPQGPDGEWEETINRPNRDEKVHEDPKTGKTVVLPPGCCAEYTDNPKYLFNVPGDKLYLVEGNARDFKTSEQGSRAVMLSGTEKERIGLEIIAKFQVTEELEKALDLRFRQ